MKKEKKDFKTIKEIMPTVKKQYYQPKIQKLLGDWTKEAQHNIKVNLSMIAGHSYKWTEEIQQVHKSLMFYFYGIESDLSLDKGIALVGPYGTGKSTIFNIWHNYLRTVHPFCKNLFINGSLEEILEDVSKNGYIDRKFVYNIKEDARSARSYDPKHILINEFGHKYNIRTYGTDINELFESFMMKRYDIFQQQNKVTHITTNYGTDQLTEIFHPKLVDRFKEMFNIIELKGESFRK